MRTRWAWALLAAVAASVSAQEPQPAAIDAATIESGSGVGLTYAWRFAPGDDPSRRDPGFDDSGWATVPPGEAPASAEPVVWFRRHLEIDRDLIGKPVVVRLDAPGTSDVFLDGRPLLSATSEEAGTAGAWTTTRVTPGTSVLAVRRECPGCSPRFLIRLESPRGAVHRRAQLGFDAVLATVPVVLALIHFGLWASDRRARENLFVALSLLAFAGIVAFSAGADLAQWNAAFAPLIRFMTPSIIASVFFILTTYYEIRCERWPRTWKAFAVAGAMLAIATAAVTDSDFRNAAWSIYFLAVIFEVVRLETRARTPTPTRPETRVRPLAIAMIILGVSIVLQVLVVIGLLPNRFPWGRIYYVGLISFAVGTSMFTVKSFAATRRKLERNEGEIASARKLQEAMLPRTLPAPEGLEVAAWLETATDVGGDYYDFREAPDGRLLLAVGDAAGHGLAAGAMVTAMKALFGTVRDDESLEAILDRCDGVLRRMDVRLLHMCLSLVRFGADAVEVCSAAMPPALVHRAATGRVEEVGAGGLPLGGALRGTWQVRAVPFLPGDTLLLASDGLAELLDAGGTPFGFDAAAAALARSAGGSAGEVVDRLRAEAERWRGGAPQADDITIVVVRRT